MRLITADDVCVAMEATLVAHLNDVVTAMEWDLDEVKTWDQVPDLEALSTAKLPAAAIESPGLVRPPSDTQDGTDATWRIVVGIYDRGTSYKDTASRIRRWAAAIRAVGLANKSLGGIAVNLTWAGEEYARRPGKGDARTLGGCAVAFDVTVENVVELPLPPVGAEPNPLVQTTHPIITVRPQGSSA